MRVTMDNMERLDERVWRSQVKSTDFRLFGQAKNALGDVTVIYLSEAHYSEAEKVLSFDPSDVYLLNAGSSDRALIIAGDRTDDTAIRGHSATSPAPSDSDGASTEVLAYVAGDDDFRGQLPPEIRALGEGLLDEVRRRFGGMLIHYPTSGKYVESPNNFWTVKVQQRDKSLRITVRGRPELFRVPAEIVLKADMNGYSGFKVSRLDQLGPALSVITQARKNGLGRRRSRAA